MTTDRQVDRISKDEAIAVLRKHAWTERIDEEKYAEAVEKVQAICAPAGAGPERKVCARDILAAIDEALGTPRVLIHCFMGGMGADWSLEGAVKLVERADEVAWVDNLFRHDLGVLADGKVHCFDVRKAASRGTDVNIKER